MSKSSWAERMTKTAKGEDIKKEYMNKPSYNKLLQQNIKLKKELSELQEAYNISMLENNKLRKKLEESKKRIIDLEKCIELSLEADGIIEKVKEVNK